MSQPVKHYKVRYRRVGSDTVLVDYVTSVSEATLRAQYEAAPSVVEVCSIDWINPKEPR